MSGIVGILNLDGASVDIQLLTALTRSLDFRGPDADGMWVRDCIGLGHTHLVTDGERPLCGPVSLDGRLWVTADARLDARDSLVRNLRAKGEHVSTSASDAELILRAYRVWSSRCLDHLAGDFAFAIWDAELERLLMARDPLGLKQLYHAVIDDTVVFSNTLDCVRLHPAVSSRLNELAVADYLLFGNNEDDGSTTFADIRRVRPGHVIEADVRRGVLAERSYWTFDYPSPLRFRRESEYVEQFRDVLRLAVEDRVRGSSCAIFLSGGIDSSAIAAMAQEVLARRDSRSGLSALTWVYDRLVPHDEGHYAELVARHLGISLCRFSADDFAWFERLGERDYRTPEPFDDPGYALSVELYRAVARQSRVVLYGEDGDALFQMPSLSSMLHSRPFTDVARDIARFVRARRARPPLGLGILGFARRRASANAKFPEWLNPDLVRKWSLRERFRSVWDRWRESGHTGRTFVPERFTQPFCQSIWASLDAGFTGRRLDVRLPLLDLRVIRYVLAVPPFQWYQGKRLLRAAMSGLLPGEVLERPKTPVRGFWEARLRQPELASIMKTMTAVPELSDFVRPEAIPAFDSGAPVVDAWSNLRPWLLNQWLTHARPAGGFSLGTTEVAC